MNPYIPSGITGKTKKQKQYMPMNQRYKTFVRSDRTNKVNFFQEGWVFWKDYYIECVGFAKAHPRKQKERIRYIPE